MGGEAHVSSAFLHRRKRESDNRNECQRNAQEAFQEGANTSNERVDFRFFRIVALFRAHNSEARQELQGEGSGALLVFAEQRISVKYPLHPPPQQLPHPFQILSSFLSLLFRCQGLLR